MSAVIAESAPGRAAAPAVSAAPPAQSANAQATPEPSTGMATAGSLLPQSAGSTLDALKALMAQPAVRRTIPGIIGMFLILIFLFMYSWIQSPQYRPLFPGMSETDRQSAYEALNSGGFPVRVSRMSGQLEVRESRYHEARLFLAGQGLPLTAAPGGFDALGEQSSLTTSQFMEQARFNVAIERELAQTIAQISTVSSARVHLAMARQSPFVRDRTPPKASVTVTPHSGRRLSENQVNAIVHLVASSVPYLTTENVSVVDNQGTLLTDRSDDPALGLSGTQLRQRRAVEHDLRTRVLQILSPIVGEDNVRAEIDVVMDFTVVETTIEKFDEDSKGPLTRSEMLAEERSARLDAFGVPGALTNQPPPPPGFDEDTEAAPDQPGTEGLLSTRSTRNFELDRSVQHVRNQVGSIRRISVAVVLNDNGMNGAVDSEDEPRQPRFTEEQLQRYTALVQNAVGASDDRGDQVTLVAAPFEPVRPPTLVNWWESASVISLIKAALSLLVFALLVLTVVRPVIRSFLGSDSQDGALSSEDAKKALASDGDISQEDLDMIEIGEGESLEDIKAKLKPKKSSISADMLDTANTYDDKVALIRMIVSEDAGRVANVMKKMIRTL